MERVRFFYDFTSPYSYLASQRMDDLAARTGAEIEWIPAFLAAIMKTTGNTPPATLPARGVYMLRDVERWAAFYGVPFRLSPHFPLNSLSALRAAVAIAAERPDHYRAFIDRTFRAAWAEGVDLANRAEVLKLAAEEDRALVEASLDAQPVKDRLKANTEAALAAGAFGLPAFVVGDDELFFGNDRIELLAWRLQRGR